MGGRVARFDAAPPDAAPLGAARSDADPAPAPQARLDAIGTDEEPAAPVAAFAGLGAAADPADGPEPNGQGADGSAGGDSADGGPVGSDPRSGGEEVGGDPGDDPAGGAAAVAHFGDSLDAVPAAPVAELQVPGAEPAAAPRTARFGEGGRSGSLSRGGARSGGSRARREASGTPGSGFGSRRSRRDRSAPAEASDPETPPTDDGSTRGAEASERPRRGWGPKQIDPDADPLVAAREICLRLLTDRARTRHELAQALEQRGVPDDVAESVLSRFDEVGLIDDAAFAGQYVRSRHTYRGLSRRAIAMELRRKGVDDEVAGEALEEVDPESEEQRARELVDRKLRTVPADTPEQRKKAVNRLVGMLARKGYGGGIAYRVVREALAAHGAEIDELGVVDD